MNNILCKQERPKGNIHFTDINMYIGGACFKFINLEPLQSHKS